MNDEYVPIDLAKDLENKTNKNITHIGIECQPNKQARALCKVCKYLVNQVIIIILQPSGPISSKSPLSIVLNVISKLKLGIFWFTMD